MKSLTWGADISESAVFLVFCDVELLVSEPGAVAPFADSCAIYWDKSALSRLAAAIDVIIPVEQDERCIETCYAVLLNAPSVPQDGVQRLTTRQLLQETGFDAFSRVGRASQWVNWFRSHRFCGFCGSLNQIRQRGRLLRCEPCQQDFYPRINPCIIVLVTDGERILLARSQRRGAMFFSCVAGFIEPGETAEEAVAREVQEEVGVRIKDIRYVKSQPWPFPSQLMLGFYATYDSGDVVPCPEEIAEAGWYHVSALPATPAPAVSVAGQLIEEYCQRYRG